MRTIWKVKKCSCAGDGFTEHFADRSSWLLGVVWNEAMFAKIKTGARTGLSMYGRADKVKEAQ